ncbi:major facilitator superfamily transporter [Trichuris trichiura]|uniref:Major facilitator superfamily transporter n=1 Tax=Trichuris trichiura TaxID=36087 RepID=A0A077Z4Q9_TRITR|nr:major facilitator superfamily transporter [Trichuris trichiura]
MKRLRVLFRSALSGRSEEADQAVPMATDAVYCPPVVIVDEAEPSRDKEFSPVSVADGAEVLKSYKRRWFVLLVISLLNASNTMSWIAYAPVANFVDTYYGKQTSNFLSFTFILWAIPVGFLAIWSAGRFGLRLAVFLASWFNFVGAVVRILSCVPNLPQQGRFSMIVLGQCIAACCYPFVMFLPTKVAADWFPPSQRTRANVIATLCNPVGILIANFMSPKLVVDLSGIVLLHSVLVLPAALVCLMATFGIRTSAPPLPPSHSAAAESLSFKLGLRKAFQSRTYLLLLLALGTGIGCFNTLYTVMQQLLCSRGYGNEFAGLCCVLMNVSGLVGSVLVGYFVDRTKLFVETIKVAFCLAVLSGISFSLVSLQYNLPAAVIGCAMAFGFFGVAVYPLGFEMGAECMFPVAETTSAGLITFAGQLGSIIFIPIMQFLSSPMKGAASKWQACTAPNEADVPAYDMTLPMMLMVGLSAIVACIFVICFRPKYRRMIVDRQGKVLVEQNTVKPAPREGILEIKTVLVS